MYVESGKNVEREDWEHDHTGNSKYLQCYREWYKWLNKEDSEPVP